MRIGMLCATSEEMAALSAELGSGREEIIAGFVFHETPAGVYVQTGLGKINAAAVTALLIQRFGVERIVFAGVAGALNPELRTGDLVFATRVATHDYGQMSEGELIPYLSGTFPMGPGVMEAVPEVLPGIQAELAALKAVMAPRLQAKIVLGTVVTGDSFVNCSATGRRLNTRFKADAVDMESAAVVQVADRFGVPAYILRSISDSADDESEASYVANAVPIAKVAAACVLELCRILQAIPAET